MFSKIGKLIFENEAVAKTSDFTMGIEVEMHRIDDLGNLSQEPYPASIGDEKTNNWITTDFTETMSEIVTPPAAYALDAMHYLYGINNVLRSSLAPGELLWPLSMPPKLPKDTSHIRLAQWGPEKEAYLKEWARRHRFAEGMPCGIHINLSVDQHIIELVLKNFPDRFKTELEAKNYLYEILAQGFVRYRWLITYLFGASPIAEKNYFDNDFKLEHPVRSVRQSSVGFGNKFAGDYTSVQAYVDRITRGVKEKILIKDYEFHGPVRFKGNPVLQELPKTGAEYIELRMLDLDPSSSVGIRTDTLRFIRLLASYLIMSPALKPGEVNRVLKQADQMNEEVATEHPLSTCKYQNKARALIRSLELYANQIQLGPEYQEILDDLEDRVENAKTTPSARLLAYIKDGSLEEYALRRARRYQRAAQESILKFDGFEDRQYSAKELKQALFRGNWDPNLGRR